MISNQDLLACAVAAARRAGDHALAHIDRRHETFETAAHDVKLKLDGECQAVAMSVVESAFPQHSVLGEEDAWARAGGLRDEGVGCSVQGGVAVGDHGTADYQWIVDPIDGTVNFTHGMQFWCCSIAVQYRGRTLAGAVYAPELGELYTATSDGPAERNGEELHVSQVPTVAGAMIATGIDKNVRPDVPAFGFLQRIATHAQKARILGSAALDLCSVAAGRLDGYFETGIYIWDVAAGALIVERAGGCAELLGIKDPAENSLIFLASNGHIQDEFKELLGF